MILFDFRYQDPWAEENFALRDFVQQGQAKQRQDQQVEINRQTLDKLLTKLSLKDIVGLQTELFTGRSAKFVHDGVIFG